MLETIDKIFKDNEGSSRLQPQELDDLGDYWKILCYLHSGVTMSNK